MTKIKVTADFELAGMRGTITVEGPADTDKDGLPEVLVSIDGPIDFLDVDKMPIEVPADALGALAKFFGVILSRLPFGG